MIEGYINCIKKGLIPYSYTGDKYNNHNSTQPITTTTQPIITTTQPIITTTLTTTDIDLNIDDNNDNDSFVDLFDDQSFFLNEFLESNDNYCLPCESINNLNENLTTISDHSKEHVIIEQQVVLPTNSILQGWMQHIVNVPKFDTLSLNKQSNKRSKASVSISVVTQAFGF